MDARSFLFSLALCGPIALPAAAADALGAAIAGDHRSSEKKARDQYRKPQQVLEFFGLAADMDVVEIWPGGGWYTQILAAALRAEGTLVAAQFDPNPPFGYMRRGFGAFLTMLGENPDLYRDVEIRTFSYPYKLKLGPKGSADLVVTFRNVHNWVSSAYPPNSFSVLAFRSMFDVLKPGGVLGVTDHRWPDPETEDPQAGNGYISKERVVALAQDAGFILEAASKLLANARDIHDHPEGVWTLPPSLALGDKDKKKYLAIGESDRFALRFRKPTNSKD